MAKPKRLPDSPEIQRRLAAIGALCQYARAGIQLKMGESAKLARAEEDIWAAIEALESLRGELAEVQPDEFAEGLSVFGRVAASEYRMNAVRRVDPNPRR